MRHSQMNQCMGCQAKWPLDRDGYHKVVGGYPGEIVGCTANRYGRPEKHYNRTMRKGQTGYHGITYFRFLQYPLCWWVWKKLFCPRDIHLFDEVYGVERHYLYCDACGLHVHIAKIKTEEQEISEIKDKVYRAMAPKGVDCTAKGQHKKGKQNER